MNRLGTSRSRSSDWAPSTGFYSRLTIGSSTRIQRPQMQYPRNPPPSQPPTHPIARDTPNRDHLRLFTTELLDLGHVASHLELCKFIFHLFEFQLPLPISGNKLNNDFRRVIDYNLFVVRIQRSYPTLWQRHPQGHRMLFQLPNPFIDAFATMQEWELNTHDGSQCIRLDFLNRIALPPSTPFESPAYFDRLRWATLGGFHASVSKEIQRFHIVEDIFSRDMGYQILRDLNFYHRPQPEDWREYFTTQVTEAQEVSPRVVVSELLDNMDTIPTAHLTMDALSTLHDLRYQRHRTTLRGKFI